MRFNTRIIVALAITAATAFAAGVIFKANPIWRLSPPVAILFSVTIVLVVAVWSAGFLAAPLRELHDDLGNALRAARDGDHSLRLAARGSGDVAELKRLYNELADAVRSDRYAIQSKEILLDTILQRSPMGIVLLNAADRIVYSNLSARDLLAPGSRLEGRNFHEVTSGVATPVRDYIERGEDALIHFDGEVFQITQRRFRLHTQEHRLVLIDRLTQELRRQELGVWKKAIRVINHEINNSIAPISSLFHSARKAQQKPGAEHRVEEIYGLIEERLSHLRQFLESYAQFARLPEPRKEQVSLERVLEAVRALYPFRLEGTADVEARLDPAQVEQVLINLLKNAHESGSGPGEVVVSIQVAASDIVLRVLDRGSGMSEDVMRRALLPFYSTKPSGSGLGLALSNEVIEAHGGRMRLAAREGGGTEVTCWLPR